MLYDVTYMWNLKNIGLAIKLVWVFRKMLWNNPNEFFGQPIQQTSEYNKKEANSQI